MFGKIEGQRLHLAKMHIANYCLVIRSLPGFTDLGRTVRDINDQFKLVPRSEVAALVADVASFCECLANQQVTAIDRGGYWKWKASAKADALAELTRELNALLR